MTVEIAAPLYALHARELFGGTLQALGVYLVATGAGQLLASPFWGRLADVSARRALILAGLMAFGLGLFALGAGGMSASAGSPWLFAFVFLGLGIAESGVRLGRKTYLVDAVPADERPLYVAFGNTAVGVATLGWGVLGFVAQGAGVPAVIGLLCVLGLTGAALAARMPEARDFDAA